MVYFAPRTLGVSWLAGLDTKTQEACPAGKVGVAPSKRELLDASLATLCCIQWLSGWNLVGLAEVDASGLALFFWGGWGFGRRG